MSIIYAPIKPNHPRCRPPEIDQQTRGTVWKCGTCERYWQVVFDPGERSYYWSPIAGWRGRRFEKKGCAK